MTLAIARPRSLMARELTRRENRRSGRRGRPQRDRVLHATNEVSVLLSMLAADEEPDSGQPLR